MTTIDGVPKNRMRLIQITAMCILRHLAENMKAIGALLARCKFERSAAVWSHAASCFFSSAVYGAGAARLLRLTLVV